MRCTGVSSAKSTCDYIALQAVCRDLADKEILLLYSAFNAGACRHEINLRSLLPGARGRRDVTGGYGSHGYLLVDEGVWVLVCFGVHSCCLVVGLVLGLCRIEALLQIRPQGEQVMQPLDISPRSLEVQILNRRVPFQLHKEALG